LIKKAIALLDTKKYPLQGKVVDNHVIIDIPQADTHYWSPQLNMRIEKDELDEKVSYLRGMIGPKPTVWTLFMFVYFSIGFLGFVMSSYGISKSFIGEKTILIWGFPIAILIMLTAYRAGKQGEKLGQEQIDIIKTYIRELAAPSKPK
jgi:hypothetical protein